MGYRAVADLRNEKIGFKIREHTLHKTPYLLVIGDREVESHTVAVRTREGKDLGTMSIAEFSEFLARAVRSEEHTSELQSRPHLVCRLLLEKKKQKIICESNED